VVEVTSLIDWELAASTARRMAPAPPHVEPDEAAAVVAELDSAAGVAAAHVAELTGLHEPPLTAVTRIVDRPGWIDVNARGMSNLTRPLVDKLSASANMGRLGEVIGGRVTGAQAGALLGFMSGKVLGQFEFFDEPNGQLLLVAPNVVDVERKLNVKPSDFRLWVCLHEVTHRVQFTAVPWMRTHMHDEVDALTSGLDLDPAAIKERLGKAMSELMKVVRGEGDGTGIAGALATPEQRIVIDRLTGFMSLVEGHAEYVMNAVSPAVIPSQPEIEARFAVRRQKGGNPLDRLLRRLLGLDAKTRQYVEGSAFVREVVDKIGLDGFNAIWTSPETLPAKAEISEPDKWIARVHG
jgi:coenzyme F420 biosynthesis associated uncharacterized protein